VSSICSRFVLNDVFDIYQDIFISFGTTAPLNVDNGLVVFISNPQIVENISTLIPFLSGDGLGILYPKTQSLLPTGHLISVALDGIGNYGLANTYAGGGTDGVTVNTPHSITTRVARNATPFEHLDTSTSINELSSINPNTYRVRMKGYLNKVYVDVLQGSEYINIYEVNTDVKIDNISRHVKIGFSYSGNSEFGLKDITYSGQTIN
jgi:hypothetical protein|tara:strand:+ start:296 stop:916 length:621 start_codon:yes stop_codon:yes gene_type:complete